MAQEKTPDATQRHRRRCSFSGCTFFYCGPTLQRFFLTFPFADSNPKRARICLSSGNPTLRRTSSSIQTGKSPPRCSHISACYVNHVVMSETRRKKTLFIPFTKKMIFPLFGSPSAVFSAESKFMPHMFVMGPSWRCRSSSLQPDLKMSI